MLKGPDRTEHEPTRERVLDAAAQLVVREGVKGLTIERVAKEAGLSRGGVFYHFPTKEAIVQGMLARLIERFEQFLDAEAERDVDEGGRWARAFVRASFKLDDETASVFSALIAAIAFDPQLLDPLRDHLRAWRRRTEEGLDPATAAVARMVSYALWLNELFDLNDLNEEERGVVIQRVVQLTRTPPSPTSANAPQPSLT